MVTCSIISCPNTLEEIEDLLICPECGSKYKWIEVDGYSVLKTIEHSLRFLEKAQINNLKQLEKMVNNL